MKGSKGDTGNRGCWKVVGRVAGHPGWTGRGLAPRGPTRRRQRVSCALTLKDLGLFFLCPESLKSFKYHDQTSNIKKSRAPRPHSSGLQWGLKGPGSGFGKRG